MKRVFRAGIASMLLSGTLVPGADSGVRRGGLVQNCQLPPLQLPTATAGKNYAYQFRRSGGVSPFTWTVTGPLPTGLTLSQNGLLRGLPTTTQSDDYPFNVTVTDSSTPKLNCTQPCTIHVDVRPLVIRR